MKFGEDPLLSTRFSGYDDDDVASHHSFPHQQFEWEQNFQTNEHMDAAMNDQFNTTRR